MENFEIYHDIAQRTGGDIYIGVVGPVRTGKSTFIKRFMDLCVLPNIENPYSKERALDELPQSAAGRTIMTTEPKFVPNEAVEISLDDATSFKVRLIDCVGYLVPGAAGYMDGDAPRMVTTPWSEERIPFTEAAEIGTKKVINDHSTIGVLITTDGSITDIPREDYLDAEARVVDEMKAINKPFVVLINTSRPYAPETDDLRSHLAEKYAVPVMAVNCEQMKTEDVNSIMEKALYEFPVMELQIHLPKWVDVLDNSHWVKSSLIEVARGLANEVTKLANVKSSISLLDSNDYIKKSYLNRINLGCGEADIEVALNDDLFYTVLSETTGMDIEGESELIATIKVLAEAKHEYDKIKFALEEVKHRGYGIVSPSLDDMTIDEPRLVKHGSRYGVKIKVSAPSLHLIQANIETEISPMVGSEQQGEDMISYFNKEREENPEKIWELNMFGKSMQDMVKDGLQTKLVGMPEDAQIKLQDTLQKIVNHGRGGLICILL